MNEKEISLADLAKEHETLKMIHRQLFDNMQLLLTNDQHQLAKEDTVIKNQSLIIRNQEIIVKNQVNIINNQRKIVSNQSTLNLILNTQVEMLHRLRKNDGIEETLSETQLYIESNRQSQDQQPLIDPELIS